MTGSDGGAAREEVARLVSGMAHELRNSLQAVAINLEVVRTRLGRDAPDLAGELERFAAAADDNVRRLGRRVDLLVAAARRGDEEVATVDLPGLVREVAAALEFDRRPPRVDVRAPEDERGVRLRRGSAVVLLGAALEAAREAAAGRDSVVASVGYAAEEATLDLPAAAPARGDWEEAASRAGGRVAPAGPGERETLSLRFPRA